MKSHLDALAVSEHPPLYNTIKYLIKRFAPDSQLDEDLDIMVGMAKKIETSNKPIHSRLHFLAEGGGKTRVVAIGDFWTQQTLKVIHEFLMDTLKRLSTDGTYSHNRVSLLTMEATRLGKDIYCFDLTAATDRFPALLQKDVISEMLGPEIASS